MAGRRRHDFDDREDHPTRGDAYRSGKAVRVAWRFRLGIVSAVVLSAVVVVNLAMPVPRLRGQSRWRACWWVLVASTNALSAVALLSSIHLDNAYWVLTARWFIERFKVTVGRAAPRPTPDILRHRYRSRRYSNHIRCPRHVPRANRLTMGQLFVPFPT